MSSIKLKIKSYKEVLTNKQLVEIIDGIISSYPITFVNLERLRKEVNEFNELFWLKDDEGKYLLVNNKFALNLHLIPSQIEGRSAENFIPAYLINFSNALDEYIKESRSELVIEGFPLSGLPAGGNYQAVEIPVTGSGGPVSAIIGIAQKKETQTIGSVSLTSLFNMIKPLLNNFILIDKNNMIKEVSEEFCEIFSLNAADIQGNYFKDSLPVVLTNTIKDFINSEHTAGEIEIKNLEMQDLKVRFLKSYDEGCLITIETREIKDQSQPLNTISNTYDLITHNNPEPVFIYDKENLRFLQVNDAALKLYGYRKDEFLQLDLTDLYIPEDIQTLLEDSEEKFKEGLYSKPCRHKRKDGTIVLVEINRTSIDYNNKDAFINVIRNVTEKLSLEKESQYFNAAFNNSGSLFFITDREGFIKSVNTAVTEVLGYSAKGLAETSLTALVKDEDRGKINSSVFQSVSKERLIFNTSLKKAGNEFLEVKLTTNPIFDYKGEVESYSIICSLEEKVREIIKEVIKEVPVEHKHDEEKISLAIPETNFLSRVFHDLLTPINVIIGFVQELTENIEQPTSEEKEALEIINQNKANLLSLMNHILEFVHLEKNQVKLQYDSVRIIDTIENVKKDIEENKITGNRELAFGKISSSLQVKTDGQKLQKLLILLVEIIIKITDEKKLFISANSVDNKDFIISFNDGYNKSSEKFVKRLSSIFSDERKIPSKVNGISFFILSLCKILLNLLEGQFKLFEEKDRKDIAFIFPLDLEERKVRDEKIPEEISEKSEDANERFEKPELVPDEDSVSKRDSQRDSTEFKSSQNIDLTKLSCLYIEDQLDSQMLFSTQMEDLKEINFVVSFEQALPLLNTKRFDFIVVDINLQGDYNGLDILRIIKTMPEYENVPVIAVTAYLFQGDKERFIEAGFNDFVSKPVFREKIINSLEKVLITPI